MTPAKILLDGTPLLPGWQPEPGRTYDLNFYNRIPVDGTEYYAPSPDPLCPSCGATLDDTPDLWHCRSCNSTFTDSQI